MIDRYILDTVTLSKMTAQQRGSAFMRSYCRIPDEILLEAQGLQDIVTLKLLDYPVTAVVLENVIVVMATIRPEDKVVDLYTNKGNGDVMLLATALTEMAISSTQLFGDRWTIATDDNGLTLKAKELGIITCRSPHLISLIGKTN
jgi:hypothetical protein